ncbi:hypothetical protein RhiirA4_510989 [Rhizophagus irregularis]|uniref:Uncharacterized protein n=1 Tax=Rhizophagus irregularis TaxID=588596 RepID=A0A2I1HFZ6_9GLOM|nr:hypothetical protein RhiirA4_510989 [Rhizophagus irregularis]
MYTSYNQNVKLFFAISSAFAIPDIGLKCVYFLLFWLNLLVNRPRFTLLKRDNTIDGKPLHENDFIVFDLKKLIWKELVGNEEVSNKANQWKLRKVKDLIEGTEKWKELEDAPKNKSRLGDLGGMTYRGLEGGSFYEGVNLTSEPTINQLLKCLLKERIILIRSHQ